MLRAFGSSAGAAKMVSFSSESPRSSYFGHLPESFPDAEKIILVSNTKCVQAIHLYRKYGFTEVPVDKEKFPFERGNIAFEMRFTAE